MNARTVSHGLSRRSLLRAGSAALATGGGLWWALAPARAAASATPAPPPEVAAAIPGARVQGAGRLRFMGLKIYEARLWAGSAAVAGTDWTQVPYAIEIVYARKLVGEQIAKRSLAEMKRQGEVAPQQAERWLAAMKATFPDVDAGQRITGVFSPGGSGPAGARFYFNGSRRGEPQDTEFARRFFGIWLSPETSEPSLRQQLLGARG